MEKFKVRDRVCSHGREGVVESIGPRGLPLVRFENAALVHVEGFACQACGTDVPAESPLCARCGSRYDDASDADGFDGSAAS